MYKALTISLMLALGLQACGSSDKKSTVETNKIVFTPVHEIQPGKVADYVSDFTLQKFRLRFEFDNTSSDIVFIEDNAEDKNLIVQYDKGLALIGFDMENEKPLNTVILLEGDTSDLENFIPVRRLDSTDIELTESGDDIIYMGSVADTSTGNKYSIRIVFNESLITAGNSSLKVNGTEATLSGTLGTSTYLQIQNMINTTNVNTLILSDVDGSVNDGINMHTGRLIRAAKLATLMPANGEAYSGGVDLFAAGSTRTFTDGGVLGVHSWCCENGKDAGELDKNDPAHGAQITYFREMLGVEKGPEFYFFTINAAPADGIHKMTRAEMVKYDLITQ